MQRLYVERKNGVVGHPEPMKSLFDDLRAALANKRLGPVATGYGQELIAVVDLERGAWRGKPVDVSAIDSLYQAKDERTLHLFVDRLPTEDLRDEAKRRIIRLHIAASPFTEVRDNATAVEEIMMSRGVNAVSTAQRPPTRGWFDQEKTPIRGVLVRQDLLAQTAKLLGYKDNRPPVSILPELQLRGALMMDLTGISSSRHIVRSEARARPEPVRRGRRRHAR